MNILQLDLNIEGFSAEKQARLNEFVNIFETLSKYDGKVINPVMGEGLVALNTSIVETSKLLDELQIKLKNLSTTKSSGGSNQQSELTNSVKAYSKAMDSATASTLRLANAQTKAEKEATALKLKLSEVTRELIAQQSLDVKSKEQQARATKALSQDYDILKQKLKEQAAAYQQLYLTQGLNSPSTKAALNQYAATAAIVSDVDTQMKKATESGNRFGKTIGSAFSQLRTLAYILPGIGIAGLFNVAFDAIGKALDSLGLFNNELEREIKLEHELTQNLNDQIQLREKVYSLTRKFNEERSGSSALNFGRAADEFKATGADKDATQKVEIEQARRELSEATAKFIPGDEKRISKLLEDQVSLLKTITQLQDAISDPKFEKEKTAKALKEVQDQMSIVAPTSFAFKVIRSFGKSYTDLTKEQVERLKTQLNLAVSDANEKIDRLSDINQKQSNLQKLENEYRKQLIDERRKVETEASKNIISLNIQRNQSIVSNQTSTESEILASLKRIRDYSKRANLVDFRNVADNNSSTSGDIQVARDKMNTENKKADQKYQDDLEKQRTEFYQRRLKANTEIRKTELEQEAIANERIFKNEQRSYTERIAAYNQYVKLKQQIQQEEFNKDIQRGASKLGGKTSLIPEEGTELLRQTNLQRSNIQADAENQVYQIVTESMQRQLRIVDEQNKIEEEKNNQAYVKALTSLNANFENRKLKYEQYKKARMEIDRKYTTSQLDAEIADDLIEIDRLEKLLSETEASLKIASDQKNEYQNKVNSNKSKGVNDLTDNRNLDEAVGTERALQDAILNIRTKLVARTNELEDDRLKRAKQRYELMEQYSKEHARNMAQIEEGLYRLVKSYIDNQYQNRLESLQLNKDTVDEQYDRESEAIEKSSLDLKNKTALEIQTAQQKKEFDKQAEKEERKLKHDQAVMDRDLTLAHIAWETEQAIMNAYATAFIDPVTAKALALERGIIGAIAAATVLATNIPSYSEGTGLTPHPGGPARYAEGNIPEIIKEPYKSPYIAWKETIGFLPRGTEVIPIATNKFPDNIPEKRDDSWDQTRWLAKQINKNNKEIKNIIKPVIKIDLRTDAFRKNIFGN